MLELRAIQLMLLVDEGTQYLLPLYERVANDSTDHHLRRKPYEFAATSLPDARQYGKGLYGR